MPPEDRQRTDPGVGGSKTVSRERTMLGTGSTQQKTEAAAAPIVVLAPTREKTVLGVAPPGAAPAARPPAKETSQQEPSPEGWDLPEAEGAEPAEPPLDAFPVEPEASIAIDLVRPRTSSSVPAPAPARAPALAPEDSESSLVPAGVPRRRGRVWLLLILVVALAAGLGYVRRDSLRPILKRAQLLLHRS
jgi:hypothetical protein